MVSLQNPSVNLAKCDQITCENEGRCIDRPDTNKGFQCECKISFFGTLCEKVASGCGSNPCQNGGDCVQEAAGIECVCHRPYHGSFCE
ncbi:hypothetical protein CAPTEDRAFT_134850, partial [Capitella teleta]